MAHEIFNMFDATRRMDRRVDVGTNTEPSFTATLRVGRLHFVQQVAPHPLSAMLQRFHHETNFSQSKPDFLYRQIEEYLNVIGDRMIESSEAEY